MKPSKSPSVHLSSSLHRNLKVKFYLLQCVGVVSDICHQALADLGTWNSNSDRLVKCEGNT